MLRAAIVLLAGLWAFMAATDAAEAAESAAETVAGESDFELVAFMTGGCMLAGLCPWYQLNGSGEYIYFQPARPFRRTLVIHQGILADEKRQALSEALAQSQLDDLENSKNVGSCPSHMDGADFQFEIYVRDKTFKLDTCRNSLSSDSLVMGLVELFEVFAGELEQSE